MFISKTKRIQLTEDTDKRYQKTGKKSDLTNPENLLEYI